MTYYEPLIYVVPPEEDGWMLKRILQGRMNLSRKLLSKLKLSEEGITVNGVRQYISVRVQAGDRVEVRMLQEESEDILPQDLPLDIIYEDDQLLILNKPAGMIVHPTHGHYVNTLANGVVHYWRSKGESYRFRPVHRLDQETSGVLAVAKNPFAHQQISEQMQRGQVLKEYTAIVHGVPQPGSGTVNEPIDRDPLAPHVRIVTPDGYPSVTHYEVEQVYRVSVPCGSGIDGIEETGDAANDGWANGGQASRVRLRLETGRTHQIRVHMQHIGCPLIGDKMYGRAAGEGLSNPSDSTHSTDPTHPTVPSGPTGLEHEEEAPQQRAAAADLLPAADLELAPAAAASTAPAAALPDAAPPEAVGPDAWIGRHALHAARLGFMHPTRREPMLFEAGLPEDIRQLLARFEPAED